MLFLLMGCNSDEMQWFETKEKAIEFGLIQELADEEAILSIEEVNGETIVIFKKTNAIGVASITKSKKGFGWYRSSPYIDLSQISTEKSDSIYKTILDVKTKSDSYIYVVIGKVTDPLVESVVIHGDGEDKILEITKNERYFYHIPSAPIESLTFSMIEVTQYIVREDAQIFFKNDEGTIFATEYDLISGSAQLLESREPEHLQIQIEFKDKKRFEEITKENLGYPLHIYFHDELLASPLIQTVISDGSVVISAYSEKSLEEKAIEIVEIINNENSR